MTNPIREAALLNIIAGEITDEHLDDAKWHRDRVLTVLDEALRKLPEELGWMCVELELQAFVPTEPDGMFRLVKMRISADHESIEQTVKLWAGDITLDRCADSPTLVELWQNKKGQRGVCLPKGFPANINQNEAYKEFYEMAVEKYQEMWRKFEDIA